MSVYSALKGIRGDLSLTNTVFASGISAATPILFESEKKDIKSKIEKNKKIIGENSEEEVLIVNDVFELEDIIKEDTDCVVAASLASAITIGFGIGAGLSENAGAHLLSVGFIGASISFVKAIKHFLLKRINDKKDLHTSRLNLVKE